MNINLPQGWPLVVQGFIRHSLRTSAASAPPLRLAPPGARVVMTAPESDPLISPLVMAAPIQLLAYHVAVLKGADVDQPRNLAKSVTVE